MNVTAKCLKGACRGQAADLRIIFNKHTKPGAQRKRLANSDFKAEAFKKPMNVDK